LWLGGLNCLGRLQTRAASTELAGKPRANIDQIVHTNSYESRSVPLFKKTFPQNVENTVNNL
jgi:hypothetical protein